MSKHAEYCAGNGAKCLCISCQRDRQEPWCCTAAHPDMAGAGGPCSKAIIKCGDYIPLEGDGHDTGEPV